jgi:hypothetical protein
MAAYGMRTDVPRIGGFHSDGTQATPRRHGHIMSDITSNRRGDVGVAALMTPRDTWEQPPSVSDTPRDTPRQTGRGRSDLHGAGRNVAGAATVIPSTFYQPSVVQPEGWHGRGKSNLPGCGIPQNTGALNKAGDLIGHDYKLSAAANLSARHQGHPAQSPARHHDPVAQRRYDAADGSYEAAMAAAAARSGDRGGAGGGHPDYGGSPDYGGGGDYYGGGPDYGFDGGCQRQMPPDGSYNGGDGSDPNIGFRQLDYKHVLAEAQRAEREQTGDIPSPPRYGRRRNEKHGVVLTDMYGYMHA